MHPADGGDALLERVVAAGLRRDRRRLGHAVADRHLRHVHLGLHSFHHLDRTRRAGHDSRPQGRKVDRLERRLGELGDEHRRHAVQGGAALRLDRLECRAWLERLAWDDDAGAVGDDREVGEHHAEAVVERHRDANAVRGRVAERLADEEAVVEDVVVRQRRALREPRRSRRVLDVDRLVELELALARTQVLDRRERCRAARPTRRRVRRCAAASRCPRAARGSRRL